MTLKDFLIFVAPTEGIYLRSADSSCTRWIRGEDEFTYGERKIMEISTTQDEFFNTPILVVRIEGGID